MKINCLVCFLSLLVIVAAFGAIVFQLHFWLIPSVCFAVGLVSALWNERFSLFLFLFLFPFINAAPELSNSPYPFNYMAVSLFLLSGICVAMVYRKFRNPESVDASQPYLDGDFVPYYLFLFVLLVSTVFLLLRWTNFTLSGYGAMGADTPISPETPLAPQVQRLSFGLIFPVVSLFIYFISPFIVFFIRKLKVKEGVIFSRLSIGFFVSVGLAVFQKISGRSFISDRLGKELKQFYGGFCDFNAFGFFAGVMFLWSTYQIRDKCVMGYITFPVALVGGILSGSRTVYFFLLAGIFNLLYVFIFSAGKGRKSFQVAIVVILILGVAGAVFFAGGTLKDRFSEGYSGDKTLYEKINGLTNGRLWMTQFTLNGIKDNFVPGIGTGNFTFYLAYKNYLPYKESGKGYLFDQSLNHYLQVFIENGIFGFILFCWFMVSLFRRADKKLLIGTILFSLLFNNFFWFPEAILLFWVVVAVSVKPGCVDGVGESDKKGVFKGFSFRKKEIIVVLGFLIFIGFNIVSFSSLHPGVWARESGIPYDYGFWYGEKDGEGNTFHWTKSESGVYLYLDGNGNSGEIKLVCGAPLGHLEGKEQRVEVYWRGDLYNEVVFKENKSVSFKIESPWDKEGFLELRVSPPFNLKKLGLSPEPRTLGVQLFVKD